MFFGLIALLVSFAISAIAIYFSVTGWVALFPTAVLGVTLMFGAIEIGKLVAAGFLHWFWKDMPRMLKYTLTMMVAIAMLITSVGVYGFLSKGHLDQSLPSENAALQIELIDTRIEIENNNITRARDRITSNESRIDGLQSIIDTLVSYDRINDNSNGKGALTIEEEQQPEREVIRTNIDTASAAIDAAATNIGALQLERLGYSQQVNAVEAKLGPMRYIVDILNFNDQDAAVQLVILVVMFVFDPFAIALLLAGLWSIQFHSKKKDDIPVVADTSIIHTAQSTPLAKNLQGSAAAEMIEAPEERIVKNGWVT